MNTGELERAKSGALALFRRWNDVTGLVPRGSGYLSELEGVIEDAVHCGAQAASDDFKRLDSETFAMFRARRAGRKP